jgi:hypothetical protein
MRTIFSFIVLPLFLLSFVSCGEKPEFEGNGTVAFQFDLNTSAGVVNKTNSGTLSFDSGFITIREIVFDGDRQGASSVSITHEQISTIDFATGLVSPPIEVEIPAGEYKSVNLGIEIQDENAGPAIVIEGEYTRTDGSISPIRFEFNSGEVFEAEAESAAIPSNIPAVAKITFDPVAWFNGVSAQKLDNANVDANGVIVISETSNAAIFDLAADGLDRNTEAVFQ